MAGEMKRPRFGLRKRIRRRWIRTRIQARRALYSEASARSVAGGIALGVFVGLTPTVGFQMAIAAVTATMLRINRVAAMLPVWISNPVTIAPIYYLDYITGTWLLPGRSPEGVRARLLEFASSISAVGLRHLWSSLGKAFGAFGRLGLEVIAPLVVGGLFIGAAGAAAAYPFAHLLVRRLRKKRKRRAGRYLPPASPS